ncbi:unnamed protein product [Rotaria sp. Silwood1]|nr:unnamed protein product [Rotaria sp. Silwood1]CAF1381447.1 unnamed protein product [Rotaria sp. Silwood1]
MKNILRQYDIIFSAINILTSSLTYETRLSIRIKHASELQAYKKCNTGATELTVDKSLNVVKGIKYRSKQNIGSPSFDMYGDFIIDCTGRYTSSPNWLKENFNLIVPTIQIHFGCSYVTFIGERFRIGDSSFDSALVISNPVDSPEKNVGFIVIPIRTIKTNNENSLGTSSTIAINCVNSEYPPNDSYENLLEWTKENLDPKYYTILKAAKVCSPLIPSRHAIDDRKYVESLGKKWPQNYILLGDSMCSFNPQYAQVISEECWFSSTTNDWKTPTLKVIETDKYGQVKTYQRDGNSTSTNNPEPRIPIMIRFMQWYGYWFLQCASKSADVSTAFVRVVNQSRSPSLLMKPTTFFAVCCIALMNYLNLS